MLACPSWKPWAVFLLKFYEFPPCVEKNGFMLVVGNSDLSNTVALETLSAILHICPLSEQFDILPTTPICNIRTRTNRGERALRL